MTKRIEIDKVAASKPLPGLREALEEANALVPDAVHTSAQVDAPAPPPVDVEPEDDWCQDLSLGQPRFDATRGGRLLRLDEALHWMMHKLELPRSAAVYKVFSPLIQWDEDDGQHRRQVLYVLNQDHYAHPLSQGDGLNPRAVDVLGDLGAPSHEAPPQAVRDFANLWEASWPGYAADPQEFYRDGWVIYCERMRGVAERNFVCNRPWQDEYHDRYELSLKEWVDRCQKTVQSLRRLAVPFGLAHELWGWGRVVAPAAEVVSLVPKPAAATLDDVATYDDLVQYRKNYKEREGVPALWTDAQVDLMAAEIDRRKGQTGIRKGIGEDLEISVQRISELLNTENKRPAETAKRTA